MNKKIWLSSPHMSGNEQKYVQEAFDTNWIAPLGPNVNEFENAIQNYIGQNKSVVALSSGTAALHMALILAGVEFGDEVLCQSFTFSASANPIIYQGAKPIFIDSEPDTWNMCPLALEEAVKISLKKGKKPKAIIITHTHGMPAKIMELLAIAIKYKIILIEDAASALGSSYKGQMCGTFGDFGILSFNGNKIITTSGGGALICKDEKTKQEAIFLATQARDNAPHYEHSKIGYNFRMSNILAGIGRGQMEVLDKRIDQRRAMHQFYKEIFKNRSDIFMLEEPSSNFYSNFWLTTILLKSFEQREKLRLYLEKQHIESRPLWKPMHLQPVFKKYQYFGTELSEELFKKGLCLPSGSNLRNNDKIRISKAIHNFLETN
ncbi:MAG: aminotransferase class I/II-fold pyridoxal phosphate-dependent enzyme [Lutibacter sp.]|uniref:aminotransferase class I/II-fold pyridoxal phosphate-dependent enzyme n=1 Tax=Lutibacter sp. TaxID=1925666 RepID=UPI00299F4767|nr:aminotransferase class I/II-fold pyridoxal phosphate-dependent enzyme [Lutibacter sp.]MDX1828798.1 aminotransferase class I/II-fold pyridoxal phosphate-dependent enzyme [Lutibacter sp.]